MGYDMYCEGDDSYFRYNITGMSQARVIMRSLGMLDERGQESWPDAADFGFKKDARGYFPDEFYQYLASMHDDSEPEPDGLDEDFKRRARKYAAAEDSVRDGQAERPTGIPSRKLGTNDGWLVTPDEIAAALAAFDAATAGGHELRDTRGHPVGADIAIYFMEFVEYLRHCQASGGFRVH